MSEPSSKWATAALFAPATSASRQAWMVDLLARLRVLFLLKLVGIPSFIGLFFIAYFWILRHPVGETTLMPVTSVDRLIGFEFALLPVYLTLWIYVSLAPILLADRRELFTYGAAIGTMCMVALALFLVLPSAVPPNLLDARSGTGMGMLAGIDASGNACPSLHVAAALFSAVWLGRILRRVGAPALLRVFNWVWCVAIIYSTMAIKQHVAYDVAGGLLLGAIAAWLALRLPALAGYRRARLRGPVKGEAA